jgi:hypothetical protein
MSMAVRKRLWDVDRMCAPRRCPRPLRPRWYSAVLLDDAAFVPCALSHNFHTLPFLYLVGAQMTLSPFLPRSLICNPSTHSLVTLNSWSPTPKHLQWEMG